jgi:hypothetical protein
MHNLLNLHGHLSYPPCSPDLASSDFHLFTYLKHIFVGMDMCSDEVKKTGLATDYCDAGIQELITRYNECPTLYRATDYGLHGCGVRV